jgi:murein L,D-transpeptidase YafK
LLVDTRAQTLDVMRGDRSVLNVANIAIGRFGATAEKRRGDNMTPLGQFKVSAIRESAAFHRFIALGYPDVAAAQQAFRNGLIEAAVRDRIVDAHRHGRRPPQDTPLGGHIGIHGLGGADPAIHELLNWTRGCVALTNQQVDELMPWIRVGMRVEIR